MNLLKQLATLIILFSSTLLFSQGSVLPENREPGKCYAKAYVPVSADSKFGVKIEKYPVYIGERPKNVKIKTKKIITTPAEKEWVKKKTDRNCLSADPNDCLVWCLVNTTEEESVTLEVLKKPHKLSDQEWEYQEVEVKFKKSGDTDWYEVACANDLTPNFVTKVQQMLSLKGFDADAEPGILDAKTKAALTKYQKANALPVGQFDLQTLSSLGVKLKSK